MQLKEAVKVDISSDPVAMKLRSLLCSVARAENGIEYNPLLATSFNEDLRELVQNAVEEGIKFAQKNSV